MTYNPVDGGRTYSYDAFNRLSRVVKDGVTTNYWVNALGQRTYKAQGAPNASGYVYGLGGLLMAERSWDGSGWKNYLRLPNGELVGLVQGAGLYTVHTDHLGRPELVTNASQPAGWLASMSTSVLLQALTASPGRRNMDTLQAVTG
ncbi:hypothetical protein [Marilutibacter spongiae]|uniref:RHS repeat protein n=1 Tax=Marilutibacter spongiae TaxID=2025720 RepID=A0A7W3Y5A3_9GAMM|nr:hypothetical protein [Lysobacter spongiae]MBB1059775.1 hypothetical protein [Lysobacter spongiae]